MAAMCACGSSRQQPRVWAVWVFPTFSLTEGCWWGTLCRPLHPRRQSRARMVPGLRHGPFHPDNGLVVAWRTPSSSAKFALLPHPAPRTKKCAATHSPVRRLLSLAPRPLLPLLLPVQRWEREEEEGDIFSEIVKNDWNDGFTSARCRPKAGF